MRERPDTHDLYALNPNVPDPKRGGPIPCAGTSPPFEDSNQGATPEEIEAGARQYVRKISGVQKTSPATYEVFERAVAEIAVITTRLINELPPRKEPPKTVPPLRRLNRKPSA